MEDHDAEHRSGDRPFPPRVSVLSKKEKGRHQKLLKRAKAFSDARELSGLNNSVDWTELRDLESKLCSGLSEKQPRNVSAVGPSISMRHNKSIHRVEGADHRDILHRLLQLASPSMAGKKRKRDQDSPSTKLPGWVSIHNPVATDHLGVVELHVHSSHNETEKHLKQFLGQLGEKHKKATLQVETRWFQGPQPQSLSQTLMYIPSKDAVNEKPKAQVRNTADLYEELVKLRLNADEMNEADYPIPVDSSSSKAGERQTVSVTPSGFSVENAKDFLKDCVVFVDEHSTSESQVVPYVQSVTDTGERQPRIFAVDCEMIKTTVGLELARVTLVEVESYTEGKPIATKLVWDEIVRPKHRVVDYLTVYSGMTESIIRGAVVHIEQVQAALLSTVKCQDVLIGHSLENDLKALRFVHGLVVDTAILFRPSHGRFKHSLKTLAAKLLKQQIQNTTGPHCSEEDAVAALTLACRRAIQGPYFCIWDKSQMNMIHSLSKNGVCVCVGPSEWLQRHITSQPSAIHALCCETIKDNNHKALCSWLTGQNRRARMVWAQFHLSAVSDECVAMETILQDLVEKLPANALLLVLVQRGLSDAEKLSQLRRARLNPKSTVQWTEDEDAKWRKLVDLARYGCAFWISGCRQADDNL